MGTLSQVASALKSMFGECAVMANEDHRVIIRKRKFSAQSLARVFILTFLQNPKATSEEIAVMASCCDVPVTRQAVEKRFTKTTADFFESLFRKATRLVVQSDQNLAPILERFTSVIIGDSSSVALPDSQEDRFPGRGGSHGFGRSALKLQSELDLKSGQLVCVEPVNGRQADSACAGQTAKRLSGTLRITDLGYFSTTAFASLAAVGAWFLSRTQRTTSVWIDDVHVGSVVQFLNSRQQPLVDCEAKIGVAQRLACRLIAWKVPAEVAAERRRKLKQTHKRRCRPQPCADALAACDWMWLVTNLNQDKLSMEEAVVLYRSRWQIELLFKRWKSIGLIDKFKDARNDAVRMVRFWARLCGVLIQHWIVVLSGWRSDRLLSFARITKRVPTIVKQIAEATSRDSQQLLKRVLRRFDAMVKITAKRDSRTKTGTIELLRNPKLLDYKL